MMKDSFYFSSSITDLLFKGWSPTSVAAFVGSCIILVVMVFALDAIKVIRNRLYRTVQIEQQPPDGAGVSNESSQTTLDPAESSPIITRRQPPTPVIIPSKKTRVGFHIGQSLLHILQVLLGYLLMLAVMSYNAWFIIAIAAASGLCYFFFRSAFETYTPESIPSRPPRSADQDNQDDPTEDIVT